MRQVFGTESQNLTDVLQNIEPTEEVYPAQGGDDFLVCVETYPILGVFGTGSFQFHVCYVPVRSHQYFAEEFLNAKFVIKRSQYVETELLKSHPCDETHYCS